MMLQRIHSGSPFGVTFFHVTPLSRDTCSSPSSLPVQINPFVSFDSAIVNTVP